MRPFLFALAVAIGLGGVAGWLAAGGGVNAARSDQQAWSLTAPPELGREKQEALFAALMETNHFGAASTEEPAPENAVENDQAPKIAAAWVIGDEIAIGFHGSSEGLITAGIGDSLPGGWVVVDATLEKVIIERDGEAREIEVFAYDNAGT